VAIVNTSAESLTLTAETYGSTQDNFLYGVSCKSTSFCMASGEYSNGTNDQTLIEKWNGRAWLARSVAAAPRTTTSAP
jgi:hypothetical protein